MRIVVDLDGVICEETKPYSKALPVTGAKEKLEYWTKSMGHTVIIHTARREKDRKLTVHWLKKHGIRYDKLVMGKPKGDLYIDDKALRFNGDWSFMP